MKEQGSSRERKREREGEREQLQFVSLQSVTGKKERERGKKEQIRSSKGKKYHSVCFRK